jgi:hypothetical protein
MSPTEEVSGLQAFPLAERAGWLAASLMASDGPAP